MGLFTAKSKNNNDPIVWKSGGDENMICAIEKAQETFDEFIDVLKSGKINIDNGDEAIVKFMIKGNKHGVEVEHLIVSDLKINNDILTGCIACEPQYTNAVKEGERINLTKESISDWAYHIGDDGYGGFTFKAMWLNFSRQEKDMYKYESPFWWFKFD